MKNPAINRGNCLLKTSEALEDIKDKCIDNNISVTLGNKDICYISDDEFTAIYEAIGHYKYVEKESEENR